MKLMKKWFKQQISNFKYKWSFLGVFNSPLRGLKLKWYFGEIKHGTPYFLPRKWVKCDLEDALKAWDKLGERSQQAYERTQGKATWLDYYIKHHTKPVPIKYLGFHFTTLGWKTKWNEYRFEWSPMLSIVLFGKQICIWIFPDIEFDDYRVALDCYWEAYLTYKYKTDKTKSKEERLSQLKEKYSCSWGNSEKGYTDYYQYILKPKYLK